MKVVVLGGTGFVGAPIVRELVDAKHEVVVVHRGLTETTGDGCVHVHGSRDSFADVWPQIGRSSLDCLVDVAAYSRTEAQRVLETVPDGIQLLALSSMDVYGASGALRGERGPDPAPLDETAALRTERFIHRSGSDPRNDYEKLDVEEEYLGRGATVLRLPMIYGERDDSRREEFILRRCRADRPHMPIGPGSLLWSRGYVLDIARAARLAVEVGARGEIFNICEHRTWTIAQWARQIASAAGWQGDFVRAPDHLLPEDLRLTRAFEQHLLFDSSKARSVLGWSETRPAEALQASVDWHLAHPPQSSADFTEDDAALEAG